ncbi:MAG: transcription antitermination factor NusB [Clostridia bacterium]|nr:transcription antitermination factor NusB [Clostridia bacterium]
MSRREAREIAYKMLFSQSFGDIGWDKNDIVNILDEGQKMGEKDLEFVTKILKGVSEHNSEINAIIERNLQNYRIERVFSTDIAALKLATYELKYTDTPAQVVMNEAIDIVKKYSSEKSFSFVNSVLSKIYKEISNE